MPILASEFKARGIIATGGFTRTWLEHMLDIERRRLTLEGGKPADVNAAMRAYVISHAQLLDARDPPGEQYGRRIRYYQQLQRLDVEGAWAKVAVPTLIVWGEYDWIMGRDESDRAAAILRARAPSLVTYLVRRGMDHHFHVYKDDVAAFKEQGGQFDEGAARAIVDWLKTH